MRRTAARVVLRRALAACLVGLALPAWAQSTLPERIDKLLRQGYDRPDAALAALQALDLPHADAAAERQLLLARAWVLAQSGRETEAMGCAGALRTHASRRGDAQSEAGEGAMLLADIDHFKHVNDGHGHAAGDLVLCEVARRLNEAVRGDDLVVRWGGEEFLGMALKVPAAHAEALAERVLDLIGREPVRVEGRPVQVTVSIGYAHFPLPPKVLPVAWEQAINLADMALYTAMNQGRNRAVGIVAAQADGPDDRRRIEADFDHAWHKGRVTLKVAPGPMALT